MGAPQDRVLGCAAVTVLAAVFIFSLIGVVAGVLVGYPQPKFASMHG